MRLIDADAICKECIEELILETCEGCVIKEHKLHKAIDPESLRPQGEWHLFKDEEFLIAECPNCGMVVEATQAAWWDYCPNCGAKMKGEDLQA